MITALFATLPFDVCLFWLLLFALGYRKADHAKHVLTWFLLTASMLYLCHAHYFLVGDSLWFEGLWMLCSLTVYPLFLVYICRLTSAEPLDRRWTLIVVPGLLAGVLAWTGFVAQAAWLHKGLMMVEVALVGVMGWKRLRSFDRQLHEVYADSDDVSTEQVRLLLLCFVATSVCSTCFNAIGKQFFRDSEWLVVVPSVLFSSMLFALCYVCYAQRFVASQLRHDLASDLPASSEPAPPDDHLGSILQQLMAERRLYLQHDIKIGDLARQAGTCRTYLSTYLNKELHLSFSDYINRQRIDYAKQLMARAGDAPDLERIAHEAGFSSESSFLRNLQKFG